MTSKLKWDTTDNSIFLISFVWIRSFIIICFLSTQVFSEFPEEYGPNVFLFRFVPHTLVYWKLRTVSHRPLLCRANSTIYTTNDRVLPEEESNSSYKVPDAWRNRHLSVFQKDKVHIYLRWWLSRSKFKNRRWQEQLFILKLPLLQHKNYMFATF